MTTPQGLIAQIATLKEHAREVASALSAAFEEAGEDDTDSLLLDEAERIVSAMAGDFDAAREKVLTYFGARTLAEQLESQGRNPTPKGGVR